MRPNVDAAFWRGKRVLLTGHTGFKGSWTSLWLNMMGARVFGLALPPDSAPSLFTLSGIDALVADGICDIRDRQAVCALVQEANPDIVLHMAAQPIVLRSIEQPLEAFDTNATGTANLLQSLRSAPAIKAILVVTTDKVYENNEAGQPFAEQDRLGGHDPYSASKAAAEIITQSFARTYFEAVGVPVATARGGNVIGGGDFSADRVVPDIWRALKRGEPIRLRHPNATRPWQHVLDCVSGYLCYAQALAEKRVDIRALIFGPRPEDRLSVAQLVEALQKAMNITDGWVQDQATRPREIQTLALDSRQARQLLGWREYLPGLAGLAATAQWYLAFDGGEDMRAFSQAAIERYMQQ
jgi:CDP-glucose 4,6-dehydratase